MKHKTIALLALSAVLIFSGCSEKARKSEAEKTDTSRVIVHDFVGSLIPDDTVLEKAAEDMKDGEVLLALNADGKYSRVEDDDISVSLTLMSTENQMTEEYFSKIKDKGVSDELSEMTYAEYLDDKKKDIPQEILDHFDENMRLKEMPYERVAFLLVSDHDDSFYSEEFLVKSFRRAFEMIEEDEGAKKSLETAAGSEHTVPEQARYSFISLSFGDDGSVRISVVIQTYGDEIYTFSEDVPFEGEVTDAFESGITLTAENSFDGIMNCELSEGNDKDIYERLKALREDSEIKEGSKTDDALLTINVNNTLKSEYIYCSDGSWYYSDIVTSGCRFIPADMTESALIVDELIAYISLDIISGEDTYTMDLAQVKDTTADRESPRLKTDISDIGEVVICYIDERSTIEYYYVKYDDNIYYSEEGSSRTDAMVDGEPYYQSFDEYEYFGNSKEKYCRHEFYDIYYPAEEFEGKREPVLLAKRISDGYTFAYGFDLSVAADKYRCEIYRGDEGSIAVLLDDNGRIASAWEYGTNILTVITSVQSIEKSQFDMEEMLEHARTHTKEIADQNELDKKKTAEDWFIEDTAKYDLPDLSGSIEEGEAISDASTVQSYLDLLGSGKPFTIEYRAIGGFRNDYNYLTTDGKDFYDEKIVSSHDNSFNYELTEISIGDYTYWSDDDGSFKRYPKGEEFSDNEVLYHLPDALMPLYAGTASVKAYKGTINGEEYDIEERPMGDQTVKFFCRDGKIIAIRYNVYDRSTVLYITKFSENAEQDKIKVPGNSREVTD